MARRVSAIMSLVLLCAMLVLPAPALATRPAALEIHAMLWLMPDGSAQGGFYTSGLFDDAGAASEAFFTADGTVHGVKTLQGELGTITVRFQAQIIPTEEPTVSRALGRFVILSGTGAYEKLHGVGVTDATLDLGCFGSECPPNIEASYTGTAHFD